jgi:hypothetical protein
MPRFCRLAAATAAIFETHIRKIQALAWLPANEHLDSVVARKPDFDVIPARGPARLVVFAKD